MRTTVRHLLTHRFRLVVGLVTGVIQLPAVLWLCGAVGGPWPILFAALFSAPYLARLRSPWASENTHFTTYVALAWWTACLLFAALWPVAWIAAALGAPQGFAAAFAVSVLLGITGVSAQPQVRRATVSIRGLPPALDGYRIGQISDVHCGPQTPATRVRRWVDRLNALDVDLMTVTGDLITSGHSHVQAVAEALGHLQARDGVFACMGNHDYFTDGEQMVRALQNEGLTVLRNRGVVVGEKLYVAGVDDTWTRRHDVARAMRQRPQGMPSVLLAHDPNLFPQAVAHNVTLTLSGHTHGGQLAVPGVRRWSLARFVSQFTAGLYQRSGAWLYVNRGAGTTGPPVRIGAPAELTVLTLRAA